MSEESVPYDIVINVNKIAFLSILGGITIGSAIIGLLYLVGLIN